LVGCGGGDEESSSTAVSPTTTTAAAAKGTHQAGSANSGGKDESRPDRTRPPDIQHSDSGGGSGQFRSKGGDNSIQEFGHEAGDSERKAAAAVLHAFFDSRAARRWGTACSNMSAKLIASLEQVVARAEGVANGCAAILGGLSAGVPNSALGEVAVADVGSLRTDGRRGFLLYHGFHKAEYAMPIVIEEGVWKVSALEGSPLL
jgi:hypothetical protein